MGGSTSTRPDPPMYPPTTEADASTSTSTTPRTAPPPPAPQPVEADPSAEEIAEPETPVEIAAEDAYTTPVPSSKRRKSNHSTTVAQTTTSMGEATRETSQIEKNAMYGKRYEVMMDTLELAVKASSEKWT